MDKNTGLARNSTEYDKIIRQWNDTAREYDKNATVVEQFERIVAVQPDAPALVADGTEYSYRELNCRANHVAAIIRGATAGECLRDNLIAIYIRRNVNMIAGIWGILKSGAAYVPVEPGEAAERLRHKIADSGCRVILTDDESRPELEQILDKEIRNGAAVISLTAAMDLTEQDDINPEQVNGPCDLAYVIYTSGSTGKPKGAAIEHRALVEKVTAMRRDFGMDKATVLLLRTTFMFDVSLMETVGIFLVGGVGILADSTAQRDVAELVRLIERYAVNTVQLTPGYLSVFATENLPETAVNWFVAGEALSSYIAAAFLRANPGARLVNLYGPTEATVYATGVQVKLADVEKITIGKAMANTSCYILNEKLQPVAAGMPGELYIGGAGLARCYINNPGLTAERFLFVDTENWMLAAEGSAAGVQRLYKTGDLCRWRSDGEIEYIGRTDFQVKIRGYRIELGEIEKALQGFPGIKQAIVVVREQQGEKYLAGFYTLAAGAIVDSGKLRDYLFSEISDYMVPAQLLAIPEMPQNANGKIDRGRLPETVFSAEREEYVAPYGELENRIARIWAEILRLQPGSIGRHDNFFKLGGDSLRAIRVAQKVGKVPANELFANPVLLDYARRIEKIRWAQAGEMCDVDLTEDSEAAEARRNYLARVAAETITLEKQLPRAVLLTGATGFLGAYLLRELLRQTTATIYCIVRARNNEHARQRLLQNLAHYFPGSGEIAVGVQRVRVLAGNLERPQFGLSDERYDELKSVKVIVNSAANVRYFGNYDSFYAANVLTVGQLVKLAGEAAAVLQHISTISVFERRAEDPAGFYSEYDTEYGAQSDKIYVQTKRLAEEYIREAVTKGLKANIYRAGNIVSPRARGAAQANISENAFYNLVRAFVGVGYVPADFRVDFSHVDTLAEAIVRLSCTNLVGEVFHVFNPQLKNVTEMLVNEVPGMSVVSWVDMAEFVGRNIDNPWYSYHIESLLLVCGQLSGGSMDDVTELAADRTVAILERLSCRWPDSALAVLREYIRYRN